MRVVCEARPTTDKRPRRWPPAGGAATLDAMAPLLEPPSEEMLVLARALVRDPTVPPQVDDPALREAVRRVQERFDAYDEALIKQAREEGRDPLARDALESAIAHRIMEARLEVVAERDDPEPRAS